MWGYQVGKRLVQHSADGITDAKGQVCFPARLIASPDKPVGRRLLRYFAEQDLAYLSQVYIAKPGYEMVWIHSVGDSRVTVTRDGLRTNLTLGPAR
jgi:hypothetical protein